MESKGSRGKLLTASLVAALIGALIPAVLYFRSPVPPLTPEMRLEIALPDVQGFVSVSSDGQRVAYMARLDDGSRAIWVRPIASETAQKLSGTNRPNGGLIWSPDSRYLAFIADGKWKKVDVVGGGVQVICDAPNPTLGLTWNREGIILFAKSGDNVIVRVSESGGEVKPVRYSTKPRRKRCM